MNTGQSLWVAVVQTFDLEMSLAVFSTRDKAVDWIASHVEHNGSTAPFLDGKTREERIAYWFGDRHSEAADGALAWGDGSCFASVSPQVVDAPPAPPRTADR